MQQHLANAPQALAPAGRVVDNARAAESDLNLAQTERELAINQAIQQHLARTSAQAGDVFSDSLAEQGCQRSTVMQDAEDLHSWPGATVLWAVVITVGATVLGSWLAEVLPVRLAMMWSGS